MSDVFRQLTEPFDGRVGTRLRHPNRTLDLEGIKRERSGYLSNVTAKENEIIGLLPDERNLLEVEFIGLRIVVLRQLSPLESLGDFSPA